jgi:hypothetical protein
MAQSSAATMARRRDILPRPGRAGRCVVISRCVDSFNVVPDVLTGPASLSRGRRMLRCSENTSPRRGAGILRRRKI